jgi:hypothetical protein
MDTGTAPTKDPDDQDNARERMDVVECGHLGICSLAEFEALLAEFLPDDPPTP